MSVSATQRIRVMPTRLIVAPRVSTGRDPVSFIAANMVKEQMRVKPASVLGLFTGSSSLGVYERLCDMHKKGEIDFSRAITFNLDEYVGLLNDDSRQSYLSFMKTHLFSQIGFPANRAFVPEWQTRDPELTCATYEDRINRFGPIDLQLLGIGPNGHIAFNEPGTPLNSLTHVVTLDIRTRIANSRLFMTEQERGFLGLEKDEDPYEKSASWNDEQRKVFSYILRRVPSSAMTMGISTILRAKKLVLVATKDTKAEALRRLLFETPSENLPGSLLRFHPDFTIVADVGAASRLPERVREIGLKIIP